MNHLQTSFKENVKLESMKVIVIMILHLTNSNSTLDTYLCSTFVFVTSFILYYTYVNKIVGTITPLLLITQLY